MTIALTGRLQATWDASWLTPPGGQILQSEDGT